MVLPLLLFHGRSLRANKIPKTIRSIKQVDTVRYIPNKIVHFRFPNKVLGVYSSKEIDHILAPNKLDLLIMPTDTDSVFTLHIIASSFSTAIQLIPTDIDSLFIPFIEYAPADSLRRILGIPKKWSGSGNKGYTPSESEVKRLIKAIYLNDTTITGFTVLDGDIVYGELSPTGVVIDTQLLFETEALNDLHVKTKILKRYYSPLLMGILLELKNESTEDLILRETDLYIIGVRAVALQTRYLRKGEKTRAIVVADRNILLKKVKKRFTLRR
jgi:hypothetical protein